MKTYVKSINVKSCDFKRKESESLLPCLKCKEECKGADCDMLQKWVKKCDEYAVEWDVSRNGLEMTRIICKTIIWVAMICSFVYIAIRVFK